MFFFLTLHVAANLLWIGSIASVGWLLHAAGKAATPDAAKAIGELAASIYRGLATPAFGVSFVFGLARLASHADFYMKAHWFHGKLSFALVVIALHHVIGARAKRAAAGSVQPGGASATLSVALVGAAFVTVLFAIYKTDLVR